VKNRYIISGVKWNRFGRERSYFWKIKKGTQEPPVGVVESIAVLALWCEGGRKRAPTSLRNSGNCNRKEKLTPKLT